MECFSGSRHKLNRFKLYCTPQNPLDSKEAFGMLTPRSRKLGRNLLVNIVNKADLTAPVAKKQVTESGFCDGLGCESE